MKKRWIALALVLLVAAVLAYAPARLWWGSRAPEEEAARLASAVRIEPGQVVAEMGAGSGALARAIAPRVLPGGRVIVTELSDSQLATLKTMVADERLSHVEVRRGEPSGTALPQGCCALIYMRHVFHHFTDPAAMSRAIHDSLAPGGRLAIIEFPPNWLLGILAPLMHDGNGGHGTTRDTLMSYLASAGFTIEHQDPTFTAGSYLVVARK